MNKPLGLLLASLLTTTFFTSAHASAYDDRMMSVVAGVDAGPNFQIVLHDSKCNSPRDQEFRFLARSRASGIVAQGCWYFDAERKVVVSTLETGQQGLWALNALHPRKGVNLNDFVRR